MTATDLDALAHELARFGGAVPPEDRRDARNAVGKLFRALEHGEARAALRDAGGHWQVQPWVKEGILLAFRLGRLTAVGEEGCFTFVDKDTLPVRHFRPEDGIRIVPGGTTVRAGAHLGVGVICMPPAFVNVGAWVGEGTMIDSHVLVGSCAQVGSRVHLSAGAQLGGVLEPVQALPVIIEDDVLVGGNCGVFEGTIVRERAVLAPGTQLSGGTPVIDLVRDAVYRRDGNQPLEIPAGAVVVPGTRPVTSGAGAGQGVALYAPVIVKYRDEKTDQSVRIEDFLR
jgi:2,3,4,5-tetrahydropyridine-2-carboxylate N-succinyltransferase